VDWSAFDAFSFENAGDGVLVVTIEGANSAHSLTGPQLKQLSSLWRAVDEDTDSNVVLITGRGKYFCAGGDLRHEREFTVGDYVRVKQTLEDARDLVLNILACRKVIVSAINGPAVGAGLTAGLLADISIIGENVKVADGHTRIGVAAGDHSALVWPLLCGMARSKYYLLTGRALTGAEAERIGLVSRAVPQEEVLTTALELARELGHGAQDALRWTKRSMNHWLHAAGPIFEASLGLEAVGLFGPQYREGLDAFLEKREPKFDD
jgi:enoyl-CoA hydratase